MVDPRQDERLSDWVDDRLDPRERERFEAEMRVNPELREAAEDYAAFRDRMREAMGGGDVPEGLTDRIMVRLDDERPVLRIAPWVGSVAAAAALVLVFFALRAWSGDDGVERETVARDSVETNAVDELRDGRSTVDRTLEPVDAPEGDRAGESVMVGRSQFEVPPAADPAAEPSTVVGDLKPERDAKRNKQAKGQTTLTQKPAGEAELDAGEAERVRQHDEQSRNRTARIQQLESGQPSAPTPSRRGAPGSAGPGAAASDSVPSPGAVEEQKQLMRRLDAEPEAADDEAGDLRTLELEKLAEESEVESRAVRTLLEQGAADSLPVVVFALPAQALPSKKADKDSSSAADAPQPDAWREFSQDLAQAPIEVLNERKVPAPRLRVEQPARAGRANDEFYLGADTARRGRGERAGLAVEPFEPRQDDVVFELRGDAEQVGTYLRQLSTLTRESLGSIGYQWVAPEQLPAFGESRFASVDWMARPRRESRQQRLPKSFEMSLKRLRSELREQGVQERPKSEPATGSQAQGKSRGLTAPKEQRVLIVVRRRAQ